MKRTLKQIQNESNIKALKKARLTLALKRSELAKRLGVTHKSIEKYENGRDFLSAERITKIREAIGITEGEFKRLKKGREIGKGIKKKKVLTNKDRRSYQKIITKEAKVLRSLRKQKKISQDSASKLCGYSRATMGHIENGRIELDMARIRHILSCYEVEIEEFDKCMEKDQQTNEVLEYCLTKLEKLNESKLEIVKNLLENL